MLDDGDLEVGTAQVEPEVAGCALSHVAFLQAPAQDSPVTRV
jgi:hypothetical protein